MIRKLTIKNFKAIKDLTIEFTPFTVLIGENSSGKSTVLQALDLLCSITTRDIDEYLKDREWEFGEIKSQFSSPDEQICFITEIDIDGISLLWDIAINNDGDNWIIQESIYGKDTGKCYVSFGRETADVPLDFSQLNIKSSVLKMLDVISTPQKNGKFDSVLYHLKMLLSASQNLELLAPERMRQRSKHRKSVDIGAGGEKLAVYVNGMDEDNKAELSKLVSEFIGYEVEITTTVYGLPVRADVEMFLVEKWRGGETNTKKCYISDGLLRIIALSAILVGQYGRNAQRKTTGVPAGFIMLDEIEDGINPALSEKLINRFKTFAKETKRQVLITSHSPVMLNFVDESDIQFMWRDDNGMIHAKPLFQTREMKETLEFLGPGEVWLNYPKESIIEKISDAREDCND